MKFSLQIHPLFIIFACILVYLGYFLLLLSYLIAIFLHEMAHSFVAFRLGYKLNQITLMPHGVSIGGENVYFSYKDEVMIACAGPLMNIVLAITFIALWWIFPLTYFCTDLFVLANITIAIVNFLPIYPLDGGRVLLALLSQKYTRRKGERLVKVVGIALSCLLLIGFFISSFFVPNYTLLVFGSFLFATSVLEDKNNRYTRISTLNAKMQRTNKPLKVKNVAVNQKSTLYKLYRETTPNSITKFTILNDDMQVIGYLDEEKLEKLLLIYPATSTLNRVLVNLA